MERNIQKVDKSYFPELTHLVDGIEAKDLEIASDSIKSLIKKKAVVKLTFTGKKIHCDSHDYYFPLCPNKFAIQSVYYPLYCTYNHKFCEECIFEYVKEIFTYNYLNYNGYQCMLCAYHGISGTQLLDNQNLLYVFVSIYGEQYINNIANYVPASNIIVPISSSCSICESNAKPLYMICSESHNICSQCAEKWAQNATDIKCIVNTCEGNTNCKMLINALENSQALSKLKQPFRNKGIYYNTCPKCMLLVNLDSKNKNSKCRCGQDICNNCERPAHFETCFFFESNQEFEVIDLTPPEEIGKPKTLREQEYLNAMYAFDHFLEDKSYSHYFKSAKLIVNKELEKRYAAKKKKMIQECGGEDKIGEVYIWHGSGLENYPKIMNEGLKVGGVDYGVGVAQGTRFGYGIYSATTPDTPISYAKNSGSIIACLAMKGKPSPVPINDPKQLDLGLTHSFKPVASDTEKNWWVFFTKEQVLPRFLVEYGS